MPEGESPPAPPSDWTPYIERQIREDWPDLSDQKRAFCELYIDSLDHRHAAEEAGYVARRGIKLRSEPLIRAYTLWRRGETEKLMGVQRFITKEEILARNEEIYEIAMAMEETAGVTGQGAPYRALKHDLGQARQSLELHAKLEGHLKPEEEKSAPVNVIIDMGALTGKVVSEQ